MDSPLADAEPSLRRVVDEPLVGFRECAAVEPIEAAFRAEGLEPNWAFRSNDNPTVQALVAAGVGVAVMPRLTINADDPRIAVVELGDAVTPRLIGIAQHRDRYSSPAARAFVETALESCRLEYLRRLRGVSLRGGPPSCGTRRAAPYRRGRRPTPKRPAHSVLSGRGGRPSPFRVAATRR